MALAVFTWTPAYSYELTKEHRVAETTLRNGSKKRYWKGAGPRKWVFTFRKDYPGIHEIYAFWDARKGSFESFQADIPNGVTGLEETVTVHFVETEIDLKLQGLLAGEVVLSLEEDL